MKSGLRRLVNRQTPPVPLAPPRRGGTMMSLRGGKANMEAYLRTYNRSGTVHSIVSLLQEAAASPTWHLYRKQPQDGRRRYTTGDQGSDQRIEVVQHAAISLWNMPNDFHTGFEFREGSNQHFELCGETFWVLDTETTTFPTAMWYVSPHRMEPIPDPDGFILGWMYSGPSGEQVPLMYQEVIHERSPDPLDPFRGSGPVSSILANIEQQDYATQYQRNLFLNGATPGGIITVPNKMTDREFDEMVDRWRESHAGVARAGRVGVLENGAQWSNDAPNNRDLEYGNLRLANRDEIREAWRMHKSMLGTVEDVNRANAETAKEVFNSDLMIPRLDRRRDTLNYKLLPKFGSSGTGVEFDYEPPVEISREQDNAELTAKAIAAKALIDAGFEPRDVLEAVGLPDMNVLEKATPSPALPPGWTAAPEIPTAAPDAVTASLRYLAGLNGHKYAGSSN